MFNMDNNAEVETYLAYDEPVAHLNAAIHLQRASPNPNRVPLQPRLAEGASRLVLLHCQCPTPVTWPFYAFLNARGAFARLPEDIQMANEQSRRRIHSHFIQFHVEKVRPTVSRKREHGLSSDSGDAFVQVEMPIVPASVAQNSMEQQQQAESDLNPIQQDRKRQRRMPAATMDDQRRAEMTDSVSSEQPDVIVVRDGRPNINPAQSLQVVQPVQQVQLRPSSNVTTVTILPPGYVASRGSKSAVGSDGRMLVHPAFCNKPMQPVQLPCMMQMEWHDPKYGPHQVWALLLWVDQRNKMADQSVKDLWKLTSSSDEYFYTLPPVGRSKEGNTLRGTFLHKIVHITPAGSPVADLVGKMFSSFFESAIRLAGTHSLTPPLKVWHLVHQPNVTVAHMMVDQGFFPPNVWQAVSNHPIYNNFELLSGESGNHGEPLLRMTVIQPPPKIIRHKRSICTITDPSERKLFDAGVLQESDVKSLVWQETDDFDEEEEEMPHQLPLWVQQCLAASSKRFERRSLARALRDIVFRDLCAALCEQECNELECAPEENAIGGATHRCQHGHYHTPYLSAAVCARKAADKHDRRYPRRTFSQEDRDKFGELESIFLHPTQSSAELLKRTGKPIIRSKWSCRIQFEELYTKQELDSVRLFGETIMTLMLRTLIVDHPTHGNELESMLLALEREQVIDNVTKIESLMCTNLWRPQVMEGSWNQLRKELLPCRWARMGEENKMHPAFVRKITRRMTTKLSKDTRCTTDVAFSMRWHGVVVQCVAPLW
jgi:hypothetical protein